MEGRENKELCRVVTTPVLGRFHVRRAKPEDIPKLLEIDKASREYNWTFTNFELMTRLDGHVTLVFEELPGKVAAFVLYEECEESFEIIIGGVHPGYQKSGLGSRALELLKEKLSPSGRWEITCDVRESNLAAQMFLKKNGFVCYRIEEDYCQDVDGLWSGPVQTEHAYCFRYLLPSERKGEGDANHGPE